MKSRIISKFKSNNARDIFFDNGGLPAKVGDINPIGNYNANQAILGSKESNVQSAIEDLYSLTVDPIKVGGVYISTDSTAPSSIKHVEVVTFIGDQISEYAQDTTFFILGELFKFEPETTAEIVISTILTRFEQLAIETKLITKVIRRNTRVLEFTFIDSVPKNITMNYEKNGISYTSETELQGNPGYGTWIKIGLEEKFEHTLHYFKRIA